MTRQSQGQAPRTQLDWSLVLDRVDELAAIESLEDGKALWRAGQRNSLQWIATRLRESPGVLVADEVGLGKTRLAVALAVCVAACGGRAAIVVPPGLAYQWQDEELASFLKQLMTLNLPWLKHKVSYRFLRRYADLFSSGTTYPLSKATPILLLSHGFGLPSVGQVVNPELWALPYLVKNGAWGGRALRDKVSEAQKNAATYLKDKYKCSAQLHEELNTAMVGRPSAKNFKDPHKKRLFSGLIGDLLGDFDLVVVDEAHKSRAGADVTLAEKQREGKASSRLTQLLDSILFRPHTATSRAKRVALTATPMELGVDQWKSILSRIGRIPKQVTELVHVAKDYAFAVDNLRAGTAEEIERLEEAAHHFQRAFGDVMTRRLWRDHPIVQRYAMTLSCAQAAVAHPHRIYKDEVLLLSAMRPSERHRMASAEAFAAAARGAEIGHGSKTAGIRFSQALPSLSESVGDIGPASAEVMRKIRPNTKVSTKGRSVDDSNTLKARAAQQLRCSYWQRLIQEEDHRALGEVSLNPKMALQWHPRVWGAMQKIERLAQDGEKVLVFVEYLDPMRAIERSLNIRHFLRHVRDERPIPLPQGVRATDADVLRWLRDPEFELEHLTPGAFAEKVKRFTSDYAREREHLRALCQEVIEEAGLASELAAPRLQVLTTWLVQQLCTENELWRMDDAQSAQAVRTEAQARLWSLRDPDPQGSEYDEEETGKSILNWGSIVNKLEEDLDYEDGAEGRIYAFRMSARAQSMFGGTAPATRRSRQAAFNHDQLNPRILIGQSDVMSEGLNLHRACRTVVLFHLDWNPGRIEQQIGRVDRQDSRWMKICEAALDSEIAAPSIDVYTVAVEGTYDAYRTRVIEERARLLRAQLFGEVLPQDRLLGLPQVAQNAVSRLKIDFRPPP